MPPSVKRTRGKGLLKGARYATQVRATPGWDTELDAFVWAELQSLRVLREAATGIRWAIDHMVPLRCYHASGLHVASNWQLIPFTLNNIKQSAAILMQPFEWLAYNADHGQLSIDAYMARVRLPDNT